MNAPDLVTAAFSIAGAALLLAAAMGWKLRRVITFRRAALSESERRIQVLTDNLPVVLFQILAEPRGRFRTLYVSAGIERFLGRKIDTDADAIAHFRGLVQPCDRPALDVFARRAALRDEATETTLRISGENNGTRSIHIMARRRRLADGQILLDGVLSDVTRQKELETRLRESATVDDLTGVFNRRHFFELARLEFNRARRFRHPLAVLLIDADYFKQVNDRFGHAAGDRMLAALGHAVRANLRDIDIVGRLGGEEFGALLPETPIDMALTAAERLRRAVAALRIPASGQDVAITVSIGVVALEQPDEDLEALLALADAALYGAKNQGRDRVVIAQGENSHEEDQPGNGIGHRLFDRGRGQ